MSVLLEMCRQTRLRRRLWIYQKLKFRFHILTFSRSEIATSTLAGNSCGILKSIAICMVSNRWLKVRFFSKPFHFPRRDELIIHRLRIEHTHLTHAFLLMKEDPPECIHLVVQAPLTVDHILLKSIEFQLIREKYFISTNLSVQQCSIASNYRLYQRNRSLLETLNINKGSLQPISSALRILVFCF